VNDLQRIRCIDSKHSTIAFCRGHGHELLGEWREAVDDYLLAHELDSSETAAAISLARIQAGCPLDCMRNGAKGVDNAYRMCVRTEWKDWVAVSVLAAAHAENGDFERAVEFAKKTLELAPHDKKPERQRRLDQFKAGRPFRISPTDDRPGLPAE
jgi:hypothetical protein